MALLRELPAKDELVAEAVEVPTWLLPDPVHVHLVTISDPWGEVYTRGLHVS
jgi:hypothetical protein